MLYWYIEGDRPVEWIAYSSTGLPHLWYDGTNEAGY